MATIVALPAATAQQRYAQIPASISAGLWSCDLTTDELTWSDGVYDLFDAPRGSRLDRAAAAACYTPGSRVALECRRLAAIRDRTGFMLDAQIVTGAGTRWIRIVAQVECAAGKATRLFGSKTDVTYEKMAGLLQAV
jgi:PAS domain-containing protein